MFMQYRNSNGIIGAVATGYVASFPDSPILVEKKVGKAPSLSFCIVTDRVKQRDEAGNPTTAYNSYCNCVMYYYRATAGVYEMLKKIKAGQYLMLAGRMFEQATTAQDGQIVRTPRLFVEVAIDPNLLALNQLGIDPDMWSPPKLKDAAVELETPIYNTTDEYAFD